MHFLNIPTHPMTQGAKRQQQQPVNQPMPFFLSVI
jgi:hypothetical protein